MGSENPSGADNQQETAVPCLVLDPNWIAGFVDGEGCFSVSVHRNSMMRRHGGWQLQTVFHVYQHQDHREVLEAMVPAFGCGRVRPKGPRSSVLTFAVEALRDLETAVLPFFEKHPLVVKYHDFAAFAAIVRSMRRKEHLTAVWVRASGACCLWDECQWKAALQKHRTSIGRILRDCTRDSLYVSDSVPTGGERIRTKIQSDPHGDMGS